LNLKAGDRITIELEGQSLVLRPAAESAAKLKRGKFGRLVLKAPPGAPPMTTESVARILEDFP
jgi:virulence-associated protein VagC